MHAPSNIALLNELGVGHSWSRSAGRALGRDVLDTLLLMRATEVGVRVLQPARVREVAGLAGEFRCEIECLDSPRISDHGGRHRAETGSVIIDAHGFWKAAPTIGPSRTEGRPTHRGLDLFAVKATFLNSNRSPRLLPVVSMPSGYAGLMLADARRTTLALCL